MNEIFIIGIVGSVAAVISVFFYGQRKGYKEAKSETTSAALNELTNVLKLNKKIEEDNAKIRSSLPDSWPESGIVTLPEKPAGND